MPDSLEWSLKSVKVDDSVIITPVASDSMGVRSMALIVEVEGERVFIDPGAALGPRRYGLTPTPLEYEALGNALKTIESLASECHIIVISHYHYDHHVPESDMFDGKMLFIKNPEKDINRSQHGRGMFFLKHITGRCTYKYADSTELERPWGKIVFSPPMPHGSDRTRLGYVIMTTIITDHIKITHTSDISGAISHKPKDYLVALKPDYVFMDGPPTIFLGWRLGVKDLKNSIANTKAILEATSVAVVIDHHLTRDLEYKKRLAAVYDHGRELGCEVKTFAEFMGMENRFLEAKRRIIWEKLNE